MFTVTARFTDGSQRTYTCDVADSTGPTSLVMVNAVLTNTVAAPLLQAVLSLLTVPAVPPAGEVIYAIEHRVLTTWTILEQP